MNKEIPMRIENLMIEFGRKTLLRNCSLELHPNMFVSLMGENGSGKTSLISAMMGYIRPSCGQITFWNSEFDGSARAKLNNRIGWVLSHREDYPVGLTVGQFLDLHEACRSNWDRVFANDLLCRFDLDIRKQISSLSLGEQSKVKLVKALAFHPELLVLDELTANLSSDSRQAILDVLLDEFSRGTLSVLYACHSKEEAVRLSDRVCLLTPDGIVER
jgi:ABC-2 type transport system ATP-binding protein